MFGVFERSGAREAAVNRAHQTLSRLPSNRQCLDVKIGSNPGKSNQIQSLFFQPQMGTDGDEHAGEPPALLPNGRGGGVRTGRAGGEANLLEFIGLCARLSDDFRCTTGALVLVSE